MRMDGDSPGWAADGGRRRSSNWMWKWRRRAAVAAEGKAEAMDGTWSSPFSAQSQGVDGEQGLPSPFSCPTQRRSSSSSSSQPPSKMEVKIQHFYQEEQEQEQECGSL